MIRGIQIGLHGALGVAAIGAGQAFVRDPSGGALGMSTDYLEGSPFPDFRIPGLFLAVVIGAANLFSAIALLRRHPAFAFREPGHWNAPGGLGGRADGDFGFRHWSQGIWWGTFTLVTVLGAQLVREGTSRRARGH